VNRFDAIREEDMRKPQRRLGGLASLRQGGDQRFHPGQSQGDSSASQKVTSRCLFILIHWFLG
jgi:hypothetical protein